MLEPHQNSVMATLFLFMALYLVSSTPLSSSTSQSLSKGSSLSVEKPDDVLISPNGLFSAGFQGVGVQAYCFSIWFNEPKHSRTVIWMANRDQPVNGKHSKLSLLKNGNLILTDAGHSIFWATNTASSSSSVQLQLQNNGNLVISDSKGAHLWESFNWPTDTLLPNQALTRYTQLIASRSQNNRSSGFYRLFFDDGNVLRLVFNGPETSSLYWPDPSLQINEAGRSRYNDTRIAVLDSFGRFRSSDRGEFKAGDFGEGPKRRITLDFDGNLRLYSLDETSGNWVVSWQAMSRPCRIHGACGQNSICNYDLISGRKCSCLPRFQMRNHKDWSFGCEPEFNFSSNHDEATFLELPHTVFYGYSIQILQNCTLEMCRRKCLELHNCKGFHYRFHEGQGIYYCFPKWVFRNGIRSANFSGTMYVKLSKALIFTTEHEPLKDFSLNCSGQDIEQLNRIYEIRNENGSLELLFWFACALGALEMACIFLVCFYLYRTRVGSVNNQGYFLATTGFRRFSYEELKKATQDFSEEVGRGGGGVVYKGVLSDGRVAAIKQLNQANQGEEEFLAEVSTIEKLNHMNLIDMWGYCAEGKHRLLVYEYMEHGSLAKNLSSNTLDWEKMFNIAVGTAKGLAYLHEECLEWVLHCDVKPQNILVDSNYQPRVADFGLSKILTRGGNNSSFSRIRGTRGYMAPEWIFNFPITSKVDVYSYGMVVLEMVTGKSPMADPHTSENLGEMEQISLVKWVRKKRNGNVAEAAQWLDEIIDPMMKGKYNVGVMEILVGVALQCLEEDRDARPTMSQVTEMLLQHEN